MPLSVKQGFGMCWPTKKKDRIFKSGYFFARILWVFEVAF